MTTRTEPASLRAVRRFHQYLEEVPRFWKPGLPVWLDMRVWSIDDDGRLSAVPMHALEMPSEWPNSDFFFKRTALISAAVWIKRYQPAAVVLAGEAWGYHMEEPQRASMLRVYGRTPNLMNPENREILRRLYRAELWENLFVAGEIHGGAPYFRMYRIDGEQLTPRDDIDDYGAYWQGILTGEPALLVKEIRT